MRKPLPLQLHFEEVRPSLAIPDIEQRFVLNLSKQHISCSITAHRRHAAICTDAQTVERTMTDLVDCVLLDAHTTISCIPANALVNPIVINACINRQNMLDVNRIGDRAEELFEALLAVGNVLDPRVGDFHPDAAPPPDSEKGM